MPADASPREPAPRRPLRLAGEHFVLGVRRPGPAGGPSLMMAIPKKLVPSAPVRNRIRRVIREAYRAARGRGLDAWQVRVQLQSLPQDPAAPQRDARGQGLRPFARRPTDRILARRVRADVDALLARLIARGA